jgi:hypothetical protein
MVPPHRWIMGMVALGAVSMGCTNHGASDSATSTPHPVTVAAPVTSLFPSPAPSGARSSDNPSPTSSIPELKPEHPEHWEDLKPHRLKLELLEATSDVWGLYVNRPHVSDDGSTAIVLVSPDNETNPHTILIRPLDGKTKNSEIPLLDDSCDLRVDVKCRRPKAEKQIPIANKLLAKHRWVRFQEYVPSFPDTSGSDCGKTNRDRHFRVASFDVTFTSDDPSKDAHLRIVRDDGAVITDSDIDVHAPRESEECRRGTLPYILQFGVDLERRAMFVLLDACGTEGCPSGLRFLFYRLPPPLPKAAGDATSAPKR